MVRRRQSVRVAPSLRSYVVDLLAATRARPRPLPGRQPPGRHRPRSGPRRRWPCCAAATSSCPRTSRTWPPWCSPTASSCRRTAGCTARRPRPSWSALLGSVPVPSGIATDAPPHPARSRPAGCSRLLPTSGGRVVGTYELYLAALALVLLLVVSGGLMLLSGAGWHSQPLPATETGRRRRPRDRAHPAREPLAPPHRRPLGRRSLWPWSAGDDLSVDFGPLAPRGGRTRIGGPTCRVRRGSSTFLPSRVTLVRPAGPVRVGRAVRERSSSLVVLPRIAALRSCVFFGARDPGEGRRLRSARAHGSYEFRGVRPHQPGEPLNRIHWKSTARIGRTHAARVRRPGRDRREPSSWTDTRAASWAGPRRHVRGRRRGAGSIGDYLLREGFSPGSAPARGRGAGLPLRRHHSASGTSCSRRWPEPRPRCRQSPGLPAALPGAAGPGAAPWWWSPRRWTAACPCCSGRLRDKGLPVYLVHIDGPSFVPAPDAGHRPASAPQAGLVQAVERTPAAQPPGLGHPQRHGTLRRRPG